MEMKNKESLEKELTAVNLATDSAAPSTSKKRSDIKTLEQKIAKSTEKLDAMRLLMLQYCTALQCCINMLEQDDDGQRSESSSLASSPSVSRVSYMGGFVKRASSSVKEKMSSIRKDFGKKGVAKPSSSTQIFSSKSSAQVKQSEGKNNNRLLTSILDGFSKGGRDLDENQIPEEASEASDATLLDKDSLEKKNDEEGHKMETVRLESLADGESLLVYNNGSTHVGEQRAASLPRIQVDLKEFSDDLNLNHFGSTSEMDDNRSKDDSDNGPRIDSKITRSNSDSRLEINKMVSLNPDDILRYHGNSLPKILVSEDENSESDYLVIDSSDENDMSDFYEDDRSSCGSDVGKREDSPPLNFEPRMVISGTIPKPSGSKGISGGDEEPDDDSVGDATNEHRVLSQECHSYVV